MSDWSKPTTTSNYSTEFIQQLDARLKDLAYGLDPVSVPSYTGLPTNSVRINWQGSNITLDFYNGTTWATIAKTINMTATAATTLATARSLALTGDGTATLASFNGSANVTAGLTLTSVNATTTVVGSSTTIPVLQFDSKGRATSVSSVSFANAITAGGAVTSSDITLKTGTGDTTLARIQSNAAGTILYLGTGSSAVAFTHDTLAATLQNKTLGAGCILSTQVSATTLSADTNTTQVATTAFVIGQASGIFPSMNGTATIGTSLKYARADHIHPTDTTRAPLASPTFTGIVTVPEFAGACKFSGGAGALDGGQIYLAKAPSSTAVTTDLIVDVYDSRFRFFEGGGTNRGAYLELVGESAGAGGRILTSTILSNYAPTIDSSTGGVTIPIGTTAQRGTGAAGKFRINITDDRLEYYNGSWKQIVGVLRGGGTDKVFIENQQTVNSSYTVSATMNAISAGPITINNGATVTVPNGSVWTVV